MKQLSLLKSFLLSLSLMGSATYALAELNPTIMEEAKSQEAPLLATLEDLVNIESGSKDIEGLQEIAAYMADALKNAGAEVQIIESENIYRMKDTPEALGPMVKATLKGNGTRKIMLIAHLDTVYLKGDLAKQPFTIKDNKAYGLGIIDDKQGAALILHIVKMLKNLNYQDYGTITILLNGDEEISSPASRHYITEFAKDQDIILSFEGGSLEGDLLLATSGIAAALIEIEGKSSHAGVMPEAGVNALTELSYQLSQMQDLSDNDSGLKVNWTVARAGDNRNVIPAFASAEADIRALKVSDFEKAKTAIETQISQKKLEDSVIKLNFELRRPPLEVNDASLALAKKAQQIYQDDLQKTIKIYDVAVGGGTDAAFAGLKSNAAVIESMGLSGDGAHSNNDEYILIDSIVPRLYMTTKLIMEVSQ